jgi:hypothetical protein
MSADLEALAAGSGATFTMTPVSSNFSDLRGVPGVRQDGPVRFLVRIDWTDEKTGRRGKKKP